MISIAKNSALYVNPYDIDDIRAGFIKLISDEAIRKILINNGLKNAEQYSSENISNRYLNLYLKIIQE